MASNSKITSSDPVDLTTLDDKELLALSSALRQKLSGEDFLEFMRSVLNLKTPKHYSEWLTLATENRRLLIEAHRDSWKSFFWSRALPLYEAASIPNLHTCLISYSETQARKNLYWIKQMLESTPQLLSLVPKNNTFTWQKTFLHLTNGSTIEAKGFGSAMRGGHFDRIVCDDILKDGSSMPHEDQQNFFFGVITPACRKNGKLRVIGTPLEHGDLLENLEKNSVYTFRRYPVLVDGKVWFDDEYSMENVEAWKRESPSYWYFAREYMLQRINPDRASFRESQLVHYQPREIHENDGAVRPLYKIFTVDPAMSEKGDYNGMVVTGTDASNNTFVLDSVKIRGELSVIIDKIFQLYDKHKPDLFGVEMYGFQKFLKFWLEEEMAKRNQFFSILQLESGQKRSKAMRILGLQPKIEAGRLRFRRGDDMELTSQLLAFDFGRRDNEDDLIDALAYQVSLWRAPDKAGRPLAPEGSFDKALDALERQAAPNSGYVAELFSDMLNEGGEERYVRY